MANDAKLNFALRAFEQSLAQNAKKNKQEIQKTINVAQEEDLELSRATALTVFKEMFDEYYGNNYDINSLPYMIDFKKDKNYLANSNFSVDISKFRFANEKEERKFNLNESGYSPLQIFRKRSNEYKSTFFVDGESLDKDFTEYGEDSDLKIDKMETVERDRYGQMTDDSSDSVRQANFNRVSIDRSNLRRMNNPDFIGGNSVDRIVGVIRQRAEKEIEKVHKNVRNKYVGK